MSWKIRVDYAPHGVPADEAEVSELEALIGVSLPLDYRQFHLSDGGGYISDGLAECTVPTPFGRHIITELHNVRQVINLLDSSVTPRNMICVGYGHFGMTTCLSIAGLDHGQVFSLDTEMRYYWNAETLSKLPALASSIKEFFKQRDKDELPERPWGYENCYHLANSFDIFLSKLHVRGVSEQQESI